MILLENVTFAEFCRFNQQCHSAVPRLESLLSTRWWMFWNQMIYAYRLLLRISVGSKTNGSSHISEHSMQRSFNDFSSSPLSVMNASVGNCKDGPPNFVTRLRGLLCECHSPQIICAVSGRKKRVPETCFFVFRLAALWVSFSVCNMTDALSTSSTQYFEWQKV